MLINYWDCEFNDYDELWDGEEETRLYMCSHPKNNSRACVLDNFFGDRKHECPFLD